MDVRLRKNLYSHVTSSSVLLHPTLDKRLLFHPWTDLYLMSEFGRRKHKNMWVGVYSWLVLVCLRSPNSGMRDLQIKCQTLNVKSWEQFVSTKSLEALPQYGRNLMTETSKIKRKRKERKYITNALH